MGNGQILRAVHGHGDFLFLRCIHEQQGVGIGLYLAREIVTRQGGYIKVVSEPGKGSEFSIMLTK